MIKNSFRWQALLLLFLIFSAGVTVFALDVPRMSAGELNSRLGDSDVVVLDVRGSWDWGPAESKIAGAERVDPRAVGQWLDRYPKEKTIVLYCA